jgi:hypothetical protein
LIFCQSYQCHAFPCAVLGAWHGVCCKALVRNVPGPS